jgi:hypothetical protein
MMQEHRPRQASQRKSEDNWTSQYDFFLDFTLIFVAPNINV